MVWIRLVTWATSVSVQLMAFFSGLIRVDGCADGCSGIPVGSTFHNSNRIAMQQTGAGGLGANNPFGQKQAQQGQQQGQSREQPFFSI